MGHLQKQQVGQLFDVVAVGEAVVPQDIAVVPELLDDLRGFMGDSESGRRSSAFQTVGYRSSAVTFPCAWKV
jgi:hypothetical protein